MFPRKPPTPQYRSRDRQRGVAALEFALVAVIFFTLFFGVLELARAMYAAGGHAACGGDGSQYGFQRRHGDATAA
jgi:hypothetical protein